MDRLEADLEGKATVIHIDFLSEVGREAAREYDVSIIPALLLFDGEGNLILTQKGMLNTGDMREAVANLETRIDGTPAGTDTPSAPAR
ncbi:MAG: hypothetical protein GYB66_10970 [Chloroflexi bacterium]|nr:hypothetical protein [Chloroflexota bacterium]